MLVSLAGAYPSAAAFLGRLLALHTNMRLMWKDLPDTDTLVYYELKYITAMKSCMPHNIGQLGWKDLPRTNILVYSTRAHCCTTSYRRNLRMS
jgi:hypothetical protein